MPVRAAQPGAETPDQARGWPGENPTAPGLLPLSAGRISPGILVLTISGVLMSRPANIWGRDLTSDKTSDRETGEREASWRGVLGEAGCRRPGSVLKGVSRPQQRQDSGRPAQAGGGGASPLDGQRLLC